jgi:chemotaxis protein histidine kinase CheA/ActR/RegA family two-component response regulator
MTTDDLDFQESLDRYFEIEAAELLQTIEETLIILVEEKTIERVHTLMRAAHTIKGSAANCGFKTIETIAHHLEDVFQALYPPELEIDPELGALLMEGYDCLYDPLSALLAGVPYDEAATLERTAELFARLQTHLGDFFGRETPLPTAAELGFDVIGSIFTDSIPQDLGDLSTAIASQNVAKVQDSLRSLAEFLLELGGSYSLPGIAAIANTTLLALTRHPGRVLELAPIALRNFEQAQIAIVGGDRSVGGEVSSELAAWSDNPPASAAASTSSNSSADWLSLVEFTDLEPPSVAAEISTPAEIAESDRAASMEWLSLVDAPDLTATEIDLEAAAPSTADDSSPTSEWLSLIEDADLTATDIPAASQVEAEDQFTAANSSATSEWLSLIEETDLTATDIPAADPAEAADQFTEANSESTAEWLSQIDAPADPIDEIDHDLEPVSIDNTLPEIDDLDADIIEVSSFFELENLDFNLGTISSESTPTEYLIEAIEQRSDDQHDTTDRTSELVLSGRSGVDRIFQSIWLGQSETAPAADPHQPVQPSTKATDREASPESLISVRVATIQLERLSHTIGELLIDDNQQFLRAEQLQSLAQSTVEQYRRCEQKLRLVSDWADKNAFANERSQSNSRRPSNRSKKRGKQAKQADRGVQAQFDSLELDVYSDLSILLQNLTDEIAELGTKVGNLAEMTQRSRMTLSKRKQLLASAQSELFEARTIEISSVLNRFPRMLQQMVASHRKPAQLELIGSEISIDKIIAEKLYDPLLHLIRNAYDHGIELPEIRESQGKAATGQLTIKVYQQGNRTKIEVSDDGHGLNWDKIRRRAIDLHLLEQDRAATATESELAEIMFAPGFSTAEQVNDLSGRGIGLDVVRDRLGALQGKIDVRSTVGVGTTFVMQFPLHLTTTRLLICESQGVVHALRSESISQVLLPTADRIQSQSLGSDRGTSTFLRWGDGAAQKFIPIYSVDSLLDYNCEIIANDERGANLFPVKTKNNTNTLLLLDIDGEQICLEVNRILVEQELVVKSLGQTFGLPNYIQGYSVLGDGSLTLAIDPVELLSRIRTNATATQFAPRQVPALSASVQAALPPSAGSTNEPPLATELGDSFPEQQQRISAQPGKQMQVLVVDDSLVQRQSLVRSLTKVGCQVIQASQGREGILRLQEHPRIRLVICDIEMPQMNGFEFLSYCRQDPKFSQIPIVMLTTRGGQKHRQLAMTLGAHNYLTKPQSERELLDIITQLDRPSEVSV